MKKIISLSLLILALNACSVKKSDSTSFDGTYRSNDGNTTFIIKDGHSTVTADISISYIRGNTSGAMFKLTENKTITYAKLKLENNILYSGEQKSTEAEADKEAPIIEIAKKIS
ncbi:MAG: hypothetical protein KFW21_04270 [Spirochaetota bacterium]|nr:hypothetical protein [Spirochaetota bacterium]